MDMENKNRCKLDATVDDDVLDAIDRISQLPEPIMQHILFFLPAKDAARTSVLSKTWQCVWNSLPIHNFDFTPNSFIKNHESGELEVEEKTKKLVNRVDESLLVLHEQMVRIERFRVCMTLSDNKLASTRVDKWIELVTKNYIKELDLDMNGNRYSLRETTLYRLPEMSFTGNSLTILRLKGCKLVQPICSDITKFSCLRVIALVDVDLDKQTAQNLICNCPLLESFTLEFDGSYRPFPEKLRFRNVPKLKTVELCGVEMVEIEATNIQTIHYTGWLKPVGLDLVACSNLKELKISSYITNELIEEYISKFPFLETLHLTPCGIHSLKVSSRQLKRLTLSTYIKSLKKVTINAPKLHSYELSCTKIPSSFSINNSNLQIAQLSLKPTNCLGTQWFLKLRRYLGQFKQHRDLLLDIHSQMNEFVPAQLTEISVPPLSYLKNLLLFKTQSLLDYPALIDGLFWSCHPDTLSVMSCCGCNNKFIEFLCEKLTNREDNPQCCSDSHIKCWRHYLKDVKVESFDEFYNLKVLIGIVSFESLQPLEPYKEIRFRLKW